MNLYVYLKHKGGQPVRRRMGILALALLLVLLAGCSGLSAEELYRLPEATEDYYDLQEALNGVLAEGYTYTSPTSGARQEPVQLTDLNGDGVDEAVAFFRSEEEGDIRLCVFTKADGVYTARTIDGAGTGVAAVDYANLDGLSGLEIVVTYQVSETVTQALQVYRCGWDGELTVETILTGSCSRYGLWDLDGDGLPELFCLTSSGADSSAIVEYYDGAAGRLRKGLDQRLSFPYENLRRLQKAELSDGTPVMLLSGAAGDGSLVTDLFLARAGVLEPLELDKNVNRGMFADYPYPVDIDEDGAVEFPRVEQLPAQPTDSIMPSAVRWYSVDSAGHCESRLVTYASGPGDWYLTFPETWDGAVTAREQELSSGVRTVDFYHIRTEDPGKLDLSDETAAQRILTVYTLRGTDRQAYVEEHGLSILRSDSDVIYAVDLSDSAHAWEGTITMAQVTEMFHLQGNNIGNKEGST